MEWQREKERQRDQCEEGNRKRGGGCESTFQLQFERYERDTIQHDEGTPLSSSWFRLGEARRV